MRPSSIANRAPLVQYRPMYLRRLPSGRWQATVKYAGARATVTARTRAEASQLGAARLLELGAAPARSAATVGDLLHTWQSANAARLSAGYAADAARVIARCPADFLARRAADVTPATIEALYRHLEREGYGTSGGWSSHRIARLHSVLSAAWSLGRRYEWVTGNPYADAQKPHPPRRPVSAPTTAQVAALLEAVDDTFGLYLQLAATIGSRTGETCGLRWEDITTTGATPAIVVRRSIGYTTAGLIITAGKTGPAGHRVVAIDTALAARLEQHHAGTAGPWVLSHDGGLTPWRPDYVSRRFRLLRRHLGIPDTIRNHDLRHYVATQLLAAGIPLKVVGERLGHTQLATTADTYGHYVLAADQAAAAVMENLRRPLA